MSTSWTATHQQLLRAGYTDRQLASAVAAGELTRVRRGHYARQGTPQSIVEAVRVGGLVACVSAAALHGLWTVSSRTTHVWLRHGASRLRAPGSKKRRLSPHNRQGCRLHWRPLMDPESATLDRVGVIDALSQMLLCQPRSFAIAAIDSALNKGLVTVLDVNNMCAGLPARFAVIRDLVDGRCESGTETLVRLMMLAAHLRFVPQVLFAGIGTVDFVVDGCVIVEVDGHEWHDDPDAQTRDYARDARLAALGYTVLRFDYQQVMFEPELVLRAIRTALRMHRNASQA